MASNKRKWIIPGVFTVLAGTAGAMFITEPKVGADLTIRSQQLLSENGLDWAEVKFQSRDAIISGTAENEEQQQKAQDLIKGLYGVRVVSSNIELLPTVSPYVFSGKINAGDITLAGGAPNEAIRKSLLEKSGASSNSLDLLAGYPDKIKWLGATDFALEQLKQFEQGQVSLTDLEISASGDPKSREAFDALNEAFSSNLPSGVSSGEIAISPPVEDPYVWSAKKTSTGDVLITGFSPSEQISSNLSGIIAGSTSSMLLAQGEPDNFAETALSSLETLSLLDEGEVNLGANGWSLTGKAPSQEVQALIDSKLDASLWQVAVVAPPPVVVAPPPPPAPVLPTAEPYLWSVEKNLGSFSFSGYVPQESLKTYLALQAGSVSSDNTQIAIGEPDNFSDQALAAVAALSELEKGRVAFNGTQWALVGLAKSEEAKANLLSTLKDAGVEADSWLIDIDTPPPPAPAIPTAKPYKWSAEQNDAKYSLSGFVPQESLKQYILLQVGYSATDNTMVAKGEPDGFSDNVNAGLAAIAKLENGRVAYENGQWSLAGLAKSEEEKATILETLSSEVNIENWALDIDFLPPPIPQASPYTWQATKAFQSPISLTGHVPDAEMQTMLAKSARIDNSTIATGSPKDFASNALAAISALDNLDYGAAGYDGENWFISGFLAKNATLDDLSNALNSGNIDADEWLVNVKQRAEPEPEPAPEPAPKPEPAPVASPDYRFAATLNKGKPIRLNGNIPTIQMQNYIGILAGNVATDSLMVDYPAPDDFNRSLFSGLRSLKMLENGQLSYRDQKWYLIGEAKDGETKENSLAFIAALTNGANWNTNIKIAANSVNTCNDNVAKFAQNNAILFDVGKANLKPESDIVVQHLALLMNRCEGTDIHVQGHTDSDGSDARNLTLSVDRAEAVVNALVERGVDSNRLFAIGYGESMPITTNENEAGKRKNRRTVFSIYNKSN